MSRHHVHLTTNLSMAHHVGGRRGKSIVLAVNALLMESNGYDFYCTDNDVWLVEAVPPEYLQLLAA
jgi:putative RNA 2'-phosphotransferase